MKKMLSIWTIPALMFAVTACGGPETGDPVEDGSTADSGQFVKGGLDGKADASVVASFVDFKFSGRLIASSSYNLQRKVENQLLYTVGQLNGDNSVGHGGACMKREFFYPPPGARGVSETSFGCHRGRREDRRPQGAR